MGICWQFIMEKNMYVRIMPVCARTEHGLDVSWNLEVTLRMMKNSAVLRKVDIPKWYMVQNVRISGM